MRLPDHAARARAVETAIEIQCVARRALDLTDELAETLRRLQASCREGVCRPLDGDLDRAA